MSRIFVRWTAQAPMHVQIADVGCDGPVSHGLVHDAATHDPVPSDAESDNRASAKSAVARILECRFRVGRQMRKWMCQWETMRQVRKGGAARALG